MMSTPNGCTCHQIPAESRPCIGCRGRDDSAERGVWCSKCYGGCYEDEYRESERSFVCADCWYDGGTERGTW